MPLGFFVLGLALDLMHYIAASASWGFFHRHKEKTGIGEECEFEAPSWINWAPIVFFGSKALSTVVGYIFLLSLIGQVLLSS